jgi:hypothetical protein
MHTVGLLFWGYLKMAGRICQICASTELTRRAAKLIGQGVSDRNAAIQLGLGDSDAARMAYSRHRRNCVEKVAKAVVEAANKGRAATDQKQEIVTAAEKGELNPADFLSVGALTAELRKIATRLENASSEAEHAGQLTALAQLTGQQHRNVEVRGKLAGHGGFAASKTQIGIGIGQRAFEPFVLHMHFGDRVETLVAAKEGAPDFEVLDATTGQPFTEHHGGAIVTRGEESEHDMVVVPRGYRPDRPVIDGNCTTVVGGADETPAMGNQASTAALDDLLDDGVGIDDGFCERVAIQACERATEAPSYPPTTHRTENDARAPNLAQLAARVFGGR